MDITLSLSEQDIQSDSVRIESLEHKYRAYPLLSAIREVCYMSKLGFPNKDKMERLLRHASPLAAQDQDVAAASSVLQEMVARL